MKKNNKGFTLVELLAVIVILGLLMAIAIPSVTKYITQSRKKTLISSIDSYVTAVTTAVNDNEFGAMSKEDTIYYVPVSNEENNSCVSLEKGGTDPFGNWKEAYVVVNYDSEKYSYDYYFTFYDDAGYGMALTKTEDISASSNQIINPSPVNASNITGQLNDRATNIKVLDSSSCNVSSAVDGGDSATIPSGGVYYVGVTSTAVGVYTGYTAKYETGDNMPSTPKKGDVYVYGDYEYRYNLVWYQTWMDFDAGKDAYYFPGTLELFEGWGVRVKNASKTEYGEMLSTINKKPVTNVVATFVGTPVKTVASISSNTKSMAGAFYQCETLTIAPNLPSTVINMPGTFYGCESLVSAPTIPNNVKEMTCTFEGCKSLSGTITINANPTAYSACFDYTEKNITLTGSSSKLQILANTSSRGNITVR